MWSLLTAFYRIEQNVINCIYNFTNQFILYLMVDIFRGLYAVLNIEIYNKFRLTPTLSLFDQITITLGL